MQTTKHGVSVKETVNLGNYQSVSVTMWVEKDEEINFQKEAKILKRQINKFVKNNYNIEEQ